jgi:hypothetical protein
MLSTISSILWKVLDHFQWTRDCCADVTENSLRFTYVRPSKSYSKEQIRFPASHVHAVILYHNAEQVTGTLYLRDTKQHSVVGSGDKIFVDLKNLKTLTNGRSYLSYNGI